MLIAFLLFAVRTNAQKLVPATAEQKQYMLEKISAASVAMKSLICDFEQTKDLSILSEKLVSKGKMYYRNDKRLRWEYFSPYTYTFMLNDKKILLKSESGKNVIDINSSRFFQEIVKIMMSGISGSGLSDVKSFQINYFYSENLWMVDMIPVQKDLKKMFSAVRLTFNLKDYSVDKVEMNETGGDTTVILLSNKQFNRTIEDEIFMLD
jgi:outer membrane lipoprotein carrier protein